MIAPLGTKKIAALSAALAIGFIPAAIGLGLVTWIQRQIAKASSLESSKQTVSDGFFVSLCFGIVFGGGLFLLSDFLAQFFSAGANPKDVVNYLSGYSLALFFFFQNQVINGFLIGKSQSKKRLILTLLGIPLNIVFNSILIPRMELLGAALATALSWALVFGLGLIVLKREGIPLKMSRPRQLNHVLMDIGKVSTHQVFLAQILASFFWLVSRTGTEGMVFVGILSSLALPSLYLGIGYGAVFGGWSLGSEAQNSIFKKITEQKFLIQLSALSFTVALLLLPLSGFLFSEVNFFQILQKKGPLAFWVVVLYLTNESLNTFYQRILILKGSVGSVFKIINGFYWPLALPVLYFVTKSAFFGFWGLMAGYFFYRLACMGALKFSASREYKS